MQGHQAVRGTHKTHTRPARQFATTFQLVAHDLGDGQFGNRFFQRFLQASLERDTFNVTSKIQAIDHSIQSAEQLLLR